MLGNGAGNDERLNFKEQTGADRNTVAVYGTQRGETAGAGQSRRYSPPAVVLRSESHVLGVVNDTAMNTDEWLYYFN